MALAHQIHRHSRNEDHDDDHYAGPDMAGVEVIAAGSVTSFVRKLFQMVQGECDSVVGFVADGTAFEVKDPRRLEQDILPKYFRHSRFQSLVRQLNFYSFKKISKERSVWIYKHAFFRRDEPELLHALKRKTNQHGAPGRIGGAGGVGGGIVAGDGGDDAGLDRPMVPSLSREAHDSGRSKPRPRGPNLSRLPSNSSFSGHHQQQQQQQHHHHHTGPSSFNNTGSGRHQSSSSSSTSGRQPNHHHHHQNQNHHQHHHHNQQQQQQAPPTHHQHHLSSHHAGKGGSGRSHLSSNSRGGGSAGGGPSTGGVGGAAAVPSYGGQGPSSRVPGFAWSGAGGRPVSAGGGASADYADSGGNGDGSDEAQHRGARGWASSTATGHRDSHSQHNHHSSQHHHHNNNNQHGDGSDSVAAAAGGVAPSHGYRQGPAMGDTGGGEEHGGNDNDDGGRHGVKRRTAAAVAASIAAAASAAGTGTGTDSPGRDQASALWGLSALCQVASATEDPADEEAREGVRGGGRSGLESEGRQPKRPCVADEAGVMRRGWGSAGGGRHGEGSSEEDEGEEDGITSAERDDSSASLHSRSPSSSSCGSSRSSRSSGGNSARGGCSPRRGSGSSPDLDHDGVVVASVGSGDGEDDDEGRQGGRSALTNGTGIAPYTTSGSRGVFCPTWDWGRAACEPAIRLPGSFVDRRGEREGQGRREAAAAVHGGVAEGFEMEVEEDEESSKTEGEDIDDEEDHETVCGAKEVHGLDAAAASGETRQASSARTSAVGGTPSPRTPPACPPRPRDLEADIEAEAAVGLEGIGAMFAQCCAGGNDDNDNSNASESVFLATVTNSDDGGLREMAVFCAGPAGQAPDVASPALLARLVSSFLQAEGDVAEDLRIYAEALDPAAVDVVVTGRAKPSPKEREAKELTEAVAGPTTVDPKHEGSADAAVAAATESAAATAMEATEAATATATVAAVTETPPLMDAQDGAKLLRVFCRYAACRLGRALEVASSASASTMVAAAAPERHSVAAAGGQDQQPKKKEEGVEEEMRHRFVARRVSPRLDECRWKWWRAAVRFS